MNRLSGGSPLPRLMLWVVAVIWGGGFMATRIAMDFGISPSAIMLGRFFVAAVVFSLVFARHVRRNISVGAALAGCVMGALLFLGFMTQTIGMGYTTPAKSAFLTSTNVVMVPFLWWAVVKRAPRARLLLACVFCLAGIAALSGGLVGGFSFGVGEALSLICALFFSLHIVCSGIFTLRYDAKTLVFAQFVVAAVLSLAAFMITDYDFSVFLPSPGILAVLYLGVFSTCLCYFLQGTAQQYVQPAGTALILCTEALFGTFFSVMLGYDLLSISIVCGGALIILAILVAEGVVGRKKQGVK